MSILQQVRNNMQRAYRRDYTHLFPRQYNFQHRCER